MSSRDPLAQHVQELNQGRDVDLASTRTQCKSQVSVLVISKNSSTISMAKHHSERKHALSKPLSHRQNIAVSKKSMSTW